MPKSRGDRRGCVFSEKSIYRFLSLKVTEIIFSSTILSSLCKIFQVRMLQIGKPIQGCLKAVAQHYKNFKSLADFFLILFECFITSNQHAVITCGYNLCIIWKDTEDFE